MWTFRKKHLNKDGKKIILQRWEHLNSELMNLVREGRNEDAFELALQLLDYTKDKLGRYHRNVVTVLNSLGTICILNRRYDDAELYLCSALKICERSLGRYVEEGIMINLNIAKLYHAKALDQAPPQYHEFICSEQ